MSVTDKNYEGGQPRKASTEFVTKDDENGTLMRNFEWEKRSGNFNPAEFGHEMNQLLGQSPTTETITGDSLNSLTDFDKAVESGVIDSSILQAERSSKLSKAMKNFALVSLHLSKKTTDQAIG
mmetsp:Transcript_19174/g.25974  ORF Transcript_19174/g.25974 Transcript_19174/m.25974 type:complete len:123 (+) Transcript_19174:1528-1896(+)